MVWFLKSAPEFGDVTGRVALVTGGNGGIGFANIEQLALHGAKVYMAARNESKAQQAIQQFEKLRGTETKGSIIWFPVNLSSIRDVRRAADELLRQEQKLHILVNCAGMMMADYDLSDDQIEMSVSVNHIGHFAVSTFLLPLLKDAAGEENAGNVRVITMASGVHYKISREDIGDAWDLNKTFAADSNNINKLGTRIKRYAYSKLLNVLFAKELQRRLVATNGALELYPTWIRGLLKAIGRTPLQGATAALFAATSDKIALQKDKYRGSYLNQSGHIDQPSDVAKDTRLAADLWEVSNKAVQKALADNLSEN
ncbi:NAD-P-binding protein [Lipomyces starkeyi]